MKRRVYIGLLFDREGFVFAGEVRRRHRVAFLLRNEALVQRKVGVDIGFFERLTHGGVVVRIVGLFVIDRVWNDFDRRVVVDRAGSLSVDGSDFIRRFPGIVAADIHAFALFGISEHIPEIGVLAREHVAQFVLESRADIGVGEFERSIGFLQKPLVKRFARLVHLKADV